MNLLARALAIGALALGPIVTGGAAQGDTGPVPEEWGDPTWVAAQLQVVGRENGRIPGRLGNQHVAEVNTIDEESVVGGSVLDWWCPAGVIAPFDANVETTCRLKARSWIEFDYARPETLAENWTTTLRYVNLRIPIALVDASNGVVRHSELSLHVKASGDVSQVWSEGDYMDLLFRQGAHVTGGKFMGRPWLKMSSVDVVENWFWLLRYYEPS